MKLVKIITSDGCFYEDEFYDNMTNREIIEKVLESACKEISEIYDEHLELMWRKRYTFRKKDGTYDMDFTGDTIKQIELAIQKLGKLEDLEEERLSKNGK